MHTRTAQLYLRAEPTEEGRDLLLSHRRRLHDVLGELELTPRITDREDLHRTELFLGAPVRWSDALSQYGVSVNLTSDDLLVLINLPPEHRELFPSIPGSYDVFLTGRSSAVFVLRLAPRTPTLALELVKHVEETLMGWERAGRFPVGTVNRFLHHPQYPLRGEQNGGILLDHARSKPHITLARGRISPERQRDVLRSIRQLKLAAGTTISTDRIDVRAVRSQAVIARYAPLLSPMSSQPQNTFKTSRGDDLAEAGGEGG